MRNGNRLQIVETFREQINLNRIYENTISKIEEVISNSAKTIQDKFKNSIHGIFDELDKELANGKGIDYLELDWQLMNMNEDEYLDDIHSAFDIQDLQVQFKKAFRDRSIINDADA